MIVRAFVVTITTLTIDAAGQDLYNGVDTERFRENIRVNKEENYGLSG